MIQTEVFRVVTRMSDMPKSPEVGSVGKDGSVRIGCPWDHAAAWARITRDGGIELGTRIAI